MSRAAVTGIGWVTPAGMGRARRGDAFVPGAGPLPRIERQAVFDFPMPRFKRMDGLCRLGMAGITLCLADAQLDGWYRKRTIALVAGSRYGCLQTDFAYYKSVIDPRVAPSPSLFAYTLGNCFLGEAAIAFGLTGTAFVINDGTMTDTTVLAGAFDNLCQSSPDGVLTGVCDLGPPREAGLAADDLPVGAHFVMLTPNSGNTCFSAFGELERDNGIFLFNGVPIASLIDLVEQCRLTL